jgi:Predicted redox protein, regulator of disulfide bond formation
MLDTTTTPAAAAAPRTIDARGSFCPGPLMELIRAIRESQVGDVLAVLSSDNGSRSDIPKWIEKAGHRLIGVTARDGYDEIVVEKMR